MAFTISEVRDPVGTVRDEDGFSPFYRAIQALPVGKAVVIGGMTQQNALSRARSIGLQCTPKRKFRSNKLPDGSVQITRIS